MNPRITADEMPCASGVLRGSLLEGVTAADIQAPANRNQIAV
jgi:hypothetical protein